MATNTSPPPIDPTLLQSSVSTLIGLQGTATQDNANAASEALVQQGDQGEANAYATAAQIADSNAGLSELAGQLQEFQQQRDVAMTVGSQRADISAAGFADSGSAVDLMRSSYQQGYLGSQLIAMQTDLTAGGFLDQGQAATAEQTAANAAAGEAALLQQQYTQAGSIAQANDLAGMTSLTNYLNQVSPNNTVDQTLLNDITSGNLVGVSTDIANLTNPNSPTSIGAGGGTGTGGGGTGSAQGIQNLGSTVTGAAYNGVHNIYTDQPGLPQPGSVDYTIGGVTSHNPFTTIVGGNIITFGNPSNQGQTTVTPFPNTTVKLV